MAMIKNQFKIAVCFFLLTVLLRGLSVDATCEHQDCSSDPCCDGFECIEVSPNVFECEPEGCESHEGHLCEPNVRECCEPLHCHEVTTGVFKCESEECEDHVGHSCDPNGRDCCEPLECSSTCDTCYNPSCTLKLGDTCDPNSSVCCEQRGVCSSTTNKCECEDTCTTEDDCCEGYMCVSGGCVCNKSLGDSCDPNACVDECCGLDCLQVSVGVFQCQVGS